MADRRNYNGLHLPGGQQQLSREQQVKMAIGQLAHEIYVGAASKLLTTPSHGPATASDYFRTLAEQAQLAALSYFEGIGVITLPTEEPDAPADSTPAE